MYARRPLLLHISSSRTLCRPRKIESIFISLYLHFISTSSLDPGPLLSEPRVSRCASRVDQRVVLENESLRVIFARNGEISAKFAALRKAPAAKSALPYAKLEKPILRGNVLPRVLMPGAPLAYWTVSKILRLNLEKAQLGFARVHRSH